MPSGASARCLRTDIWKPTGHTMYDKPEGWVGEAWEQEADNHVFAEWLGYPQKLFREGTEHKIYAVPAVQSVVKPSKR